MTRGLGCFCLDEPGVPPGAPPDLNPGKAGLIEAGSLRQEKQPGVFLRTPPSLKKTCNVCGQFHPMERRGERDFPEQIRHSPSNFTLPVSRGLVLLSAE